MIDKGDHVSRSALDCIAWLGGEDLAEDESAFWLYLANHAERYPVPFIPPFKKPKGLARVRRIIGCGIRTRNDARGQPVPRVLYLYDGAQHVAVDVDGDSMGANAFANAALTTANRSAFVVFRDGGRVELRLIAQRWATTLIGLGFTIDVLMGGGKLKALIVKKDKHRWYLVCWESLTGLPSGASTSFTPFTATANGRECSTATIAYYAASRVQKLLVDGFGVGLSLTISNTGLRAASRTLPEFVAKFRPLPMLVAMARAGAGFRGGLVKGSRYRGPTWLVDLNRAYTAALRYDLPWRSVLDRCEKNGVERPGMFVCRITGQRGLPSIYVGKWNGSEVDTDWHNDADGSSFLAIVPSAEFAGLRAIGYNVSPGFGMVYVRTFTLGTFVDKIVKFCQAFGWSSSEAKLSKLLGNSVYGKFAAAPIRRDLRISPTRPGPDWLVFVDEHGYPVEDFWERQKTAYQWSQHIDVAADITARVRGWMYEAQAATQLAGGEVVAMSTDALVVTVEPSDILAIHSTEVGRWKLADGDTDGIVAGPNAYTIGNKTIVPDYPNPTREAVVSLFQQNWVVADAQRSGSPRPGEPLSWRVRRTITLGYADLCTTKDGRNGPHRHTGPAPPGTASHPYTRHRSGAAPRYGTRTSVYEHAR